MDKETLCEYGSIKREIHQLQSRIRQLELDATASSTQRMTGMPMHHGFDQDAFSEYIVRKQELEEIIVSKRKDLVAKEIEIEESINILNSVQRRLIRYRYIDCMGWNRIAREMCYSVAQVHRIHGAALQILRGENEHGIH